MAEVVEEHIKATVEYTGGNVTEAAKILKLGRATVYRHINEMAAREARRDAETRN